MLVASIELPAPPPSVLGHARSKHLFDKTLATYNFDNVMLKQRNDGDVFQRPPGWTDDTDTVCMATTTETAALSVVELQNRIAKDRLRSTLKTKAEIENAPQRNLLQTDRDDQYRDFCTYRRCRFRPALLVVYEAPQSIMCRSRSATEKVREKNSRLERGIPFANTEYSVSWSDLIQDIQKRMDVDCSVRKVLVFPPSLSHAAVPLTDVMAVCGSGAFSVDVKDSSGTVHYRHSMVFSDRLSTYSANTQHRH